MKKRGLTLLSILAMLFIIVSGATASAADNYEVKQVIVTKNNINYSLSIELYSAALVEGYVSGKEVTNVVASSGKAYSITHYSEALVESGNVTGAIKFLNSTNFDTSIKTTSGGFNSKGEMISVEDEDFEVIGIE